MNIDTDADKAKMKKWLTYASMAGAALIAGVFYMLMIQTAVAIVAAGVAAAAGFTIVSFVPWFTLTVTNAKYRAIDAEKVAHLLKVQAAAAENPIETMATALADNEKAFKASERRVINAVTARDTFRDKCINFAKKYPDRAPEFDKKLASMVKVVEIKKAALQDAKASLEAGAAKLEEMKAWWEMSLALQEASAATGTEAEDSYEKLKLDTACDAVFASMHRAFAQLEVAASLEEDSADSTAQSAVQLGHSDPVVLDVPSTLVREKVVKG